MNQLSEELLKRLDMLAQKLGVAADTVFALYVRQAHLQGTLGLGLLTGAAICAGVSFTAFFGAFFRDWDGDVAMPLCIGCALAAVILLFIGCVQDPITALWNPQLWALQQLLHDLLGAK